MRLKSFSQAMLAAVLILGVSALPAFGRDTAPDSSTPPAEAGQNPAEEAGEGRSRSSPQVIVLDGVEEGGRSNLDQSEPPAAAGRSRPESEARAKARQAAFERSLNELMPTSPEQIQELRRKMDQRDKALTDTPPPVVHTRTECVSLQPGFAPPKIELTPNLVSVLVLVDRSGKPWPITSTTLGSGAYFTAQVLETSGKNQIVLSALTSHGNSNLILTLAGQDIPLVVLLETKSGLSEGRQTDGMIVYQVMERGPNAAPIVAKTPVSGPVPAQLYSVLDGIAPEGARLVKFSPAVEDTRIYQLGDVLYLRTKHKLMWPSHRAQASGVGDFAVYEIQAVPSLMISRDGRVSRVELKDASIALEGE